MPIKSWPDWEIYVRDRCCCQYCGLDGTKEIRPYRQMHVDHLIPECANGPSIALNKVVSCQGCNCTKRDYDPSENGRIVLTQDTRLLLIEKARKEIEDRYKANWDLDYEEMRRDIQDRAA